MKESASLVRKFTRKAAAFLRRATAATIRHPTRGPYVLFSFTILGLVVWIVWLALRPPRTLVAITANTESIQVVEAGGDRGEILAAPAWLSTTADPTGRCVSGIFVPSAGSLLLLARQGDDDLTAQIRPGTAGVAGKWIARDGSTRRFKENVVLRFMAKKPGCPAQTTVRIPISGAATVGMDYSPQADPDDPILILRSGHVETYARAARGIPWLQPGAGEGALFPTGAVVLPMGAQLRECAPAQDRVDWTGFAEVRPRGADIADRNIDLAAFTEAQRLSITTPGGEKTGGVNCETPAGGGGRGPANLAGREDVLGVSLLSRMVADPNVTALSLLVGFLFLLLQVALAVHVLDAGVKLQDPAAPEDAR